MNLLNSLVQKKKIIIVEFSNPIFEMIRLSRSEYSTKNVISEIQEIIEDLKKDFFRLQSQLGKKNKQLNQYQKLGKMTGKEYQKPESKMNNLNGNSNSNNKKWNSNCSNRNPNNDSPKEKYTEWHIWERESVGDYVSTKRESKREQNYVPSSPSESEKSDVEKINCKTKNSKNEATKKWKVFWKTKYEGYNWLHNR